MSTTTQPSRSVTTTNTKSDSTRNLYIESLEESLAVAWEYCALGATTCTRVPLAFNPLMLLQTELAEQRKQVLEVIVQNASLMAALSKGGGGGNGGSGGSAGGGSGGSAGGSSGLIRSKGRDWHKTPWKEKRLCPN
jgi:uncharacterized membrane protein YgcG